MGLWEKRIAEIRALKESTAREQTDKHLVEFSDFSTALTGKTFCTESDIVAASNQNYLFLCGVYFLVKDGRVIYIGQSNNIAGRIAQHVGQKDFDAYSFIQCDEDQLDILESLYIHFLNPPLNGGFTKRAGGRNGAPLSWEEIVAAYKGSRAATKRRAA